MNITTIPWGMDAREMGATAEEKTATEYSTGPGYVICERNSGSREGEIDVLRETTTFSFLFRCLPERAAAGTFEESVTDKKKVRLFPLAQAYILPTTEPRKQAPNSRVAVCRITKSCSKHKKAAAAGDQRNKVSWWRRGRVELPVQKKVARICYKLSQLLLSRPTFIC